MSSFYDDIIEFYQLFATFSPLVQYFPQYFIMKENRSVGSFSKNICFILILSSLLWVIFYFGHKYEFCLFSQAVFNILVQFFLLRTYFYLERSNLWKGFNEREEIIISRSNKDLKITFLTFATIFLLYLFIYLSYNNEYVIETTGTLSALVETTVPIP